MPFRPSTAPQRTITVRRAGGLAVLIAAVAILAILTAIGGQASRAHTDRHLQPSTPNARTTHATDPKGRGSTGAGSNLRPGSDTSVLPGPVLIADRDNNQLLEVSPQGRVLWRFPQRGDLARRQTFLLPDDAFFSPDGRKIVVTQEDDFTISSST